MTVKKKKSVPNPFITSSFRTFTNLTGLNTKVDLIRVELKIIETFWALYWYYIKLLNMQLSYTVYIKLSL